MPKNWVDIPLVSTTVKVKKRWYNPLRGLEQGIFSAMVLNIDNRIWYIVL